MFTLYVFYANIVLAKNLQLWTGGGFLTNIRGDLGPIDQFSFVFLMAGARKYEYEGERSGMSKKATQGPCDCGEQIVGIAMGS